MEQPMYSVGRAYCVAVVIRNELVVHCVCDFDSIG